MLMCFECLQLRLIFCQVIPNGQVVKAAKNVSHDYLFVKGVTVARGHEPTERITNRQLPSAVRSSLAFFRALFWFSGLQLLCLELLLST